MGSVSYYISFKILDKKRTHAVVNFIKRLRITAEQV